MMKRNWQTMRRRIWQYAIVCALALAGTWLTFNFAATSFPTHGSRPSVLTSAAAVPGAIADPRSENLQSTGGEPPVTYNEQMGGGGGKNVITVNSVRDGSVRFRGGIQLNRIPGPNVEPVNSAEAYGRTCTGCQTMGVALQINLISKTASRVAPVNQAVAVKYQCNDCLTAAWAFQFVKPVDDPTQPPPPEISEFIRSADHEFRSIAESGMTLCQAESRIKALIADYASRIRAHYDSQYQADPGSLGCPGTSTS